MAKLINGEELFQVQEKLINLVSMEDYQKMDGKDYMFLSEDILRRKVLQICGFNLRQRPVAVDADGSFVKLMSVGGKETILTCVEITIVDDEGVEVAKSSSLGSTNVTMLKDGSGPVDITSDIKTAETNAWKRAVLNLCPKPREYAEQKRKVSSDANNNSAKKGFKNVSCKVIKAASFLKNGMLTCRIVTADMVEKDFVIFTDTVGTISAGLNCSPEQLGAKLCAGAEFTAEVRENTYNGRERFVANKVSFTSSNNPTVSTTDNNSNTSNSNKVYIGEVSIIGNGVVGLNGVNVPVTIGGNAGTLAIGKEECDKLLAICRLTDLGSLASSFAKGQTYSMRVRILSPDIVEFIEFVSKREVGE